MTAKNFRAALAADPELGAGNVLAKVIEHGADLDGPGITFDVDVDGHPAWVPLTLGQLRERVAARAAWLHGHGIGPRDPVAIYVTSSADTFITSGVCTSTPPPTRLKSSGFACTPGGTASNDRFSNIVLNVGAACTKQQHLERGPEPGRRLRSQVDAIGSTRLPSW